VLGRISHKTSIKLQLGESGSTISGGHILVTAPGFLKSKLTARGKPDIDLSALKMIVYDEADELFIQEANLVCFEAMSKHLKKLDVNPQHCLFSATFTDDVINCAKALIGDYKAFPIKKEALKLKGVKQFKLSIAGQDRTDFIANLHGKLDQAMTMVFVNRKDTAL
jgi:superfamily II DNA/RNA helicase